LGGLINSNRGKGEWGKAYRGGVEKGCKAATLWAGGINLRRKTFFFLGKSPTVSKAGIGFSSSKKRVGVVVKK